MNVFRRAAVAATAVLGVVAAVKIVSPPDFFKNNQVYLVRRADHGAELVPTTKQDLLKDNETLGPQVKEWDGSIKQGVIFVPAQSGDEPRFVARGGMLISPVPLTSQTELAQACELADVVCPTRMSRFAHYSKIAVPEKKYN